jgi:hypothetical protein
MSKTKVIRVVLPEITSTANVNALVEEIMDYLADMNIAGVAFVEEEECNGKDSEQ